jgi:hypothetical protein
MLVRLQLNVALKTVSRKALNPPPAYDAESLLNDLERVAPRFEIQCS